jgi:hypothetical protein
MLSTGICFIILLGDPFLYFILLVVHARDPLLLIGPEYTGDTHLPPLILSHAHNPQHSTSRYDRVMQ